MATHSSILAWEILWTEDPGGLQSMESKESDMTQQLSQNQDKINSRLDIAEKKMSELEDVEIETIQNKTQRKRTKKKKNTQYK